MTKRHSSMRKLLARHLVPLGAALAGVGCGDVVARPQWTVTLATDAPLPQLADRLLVEVLDADGDLACGDCRRIFGAIDADRWPLSLGVVFTPEPPTVRARLFRAALTGDDGEPVGNALVDVTMTLPSDAIPAAMPLPTDCFGFVSDDPHQSCSTGGGVGPIVVMAPQRDGDALVPGTWRFAESRSCEQAIDEAMVCIPGTAYVMGDVTAPPRPVGLDVRAERLVVVGPFAMDVAEVSVRAVRELIEAGRLAWTPPREAADPYTGCTYRADGATDDLPMNCIDRDTAQLVCAAYDKDLPTEAEWELAAGNLARESSYPWGANDDVCAFAVVGRGVVGELLDNKLCRSGDRVVLAGLARADETTADVSELGIQNLGGSLAEWVLDNFAPYDQGCWTWSGGAEIDPRCEDAGSPATRGGNWSGPGVAARGASRAWRDGAATTVGFRCVRRG